MILHCPHFLVHLWDSLFLPPLGALQNSECFVLQIFALLDGFIKKSSQWLLLSPYFFLYLSYAWTLRSFSDSNFITFTLDLLSFLQNTLGFVIHLCTFSYFTSQNHVWLFFITCVNSPELHILLTINYFVYVMINTLLILYQYKIYCLFLGPLLYSSKLLKIAICSWF